MTNYKLRRVFNYCVKSDVNQKQVKKRGKTFDSSYISAFKKCVAINRANLKCEDVIIMPEDRIFINFDDYDLGPIDNGITQQGGWSGGARAGFINNDDPPYEKIVNEIYYSNNQSWCLGGRNMYGSPGEGTPFTPALNIETNSVDETAFNESIKGKTFHYSFWVNAADTGVDPTAPRAISIYNGSYQGDDRTGLNINIVKEVGGIRIFTYSFIASPESYPQNNLATDLSYNEWHNVKASVTYAADGDPENDVFIYTINDGTPQQVLSWINVWRKANPFPLSYGTRLKFAGNNTDPSGIYFDDILLELDTTPVCNSCCCNYISPPAAPASAPEDGLFAIAPPTQQIDHRVDEQLEKINNDENIPEALKLTPPEPET